MVEPLIHPAHKTEDVNRLENIRFCLFVFNGKEKDYESGFHYYGARYYWSEVLTGWMSVDPKDDKYPSISPYAYCVWNPAKLVDPDGNDWYEAKDGSIKYTTNYNSSMGKYLGKKNNFFFSDNESQ